MHASFFISIKPSGINSNTIKHRKIQTEKERKRRKKRKMQSQNSHCFPLTPPPPPPPPPYLPTSQHRILSRYFPIFVTHTAKAKHLWISGISLVSLLGLDCHPWPLDASCCNLANYVTKIFKNTSRHRSDFILYIRNR